MNECMTTPFTHRHWKTLAFLVLIFVTELSLLHRNISKSRVPDLVKGVIRGENAFIMRASNVMGVDIGDVSYTDVGNVQSIYYWIFRTGLSQKVRFSAVGVGTAHVWIDCAECNAENVRQAKSNIVQGISGASLVSKFLGTGQSLLHGRKS